MRVVIVSGITGIDKENFIANFIKKAGIKKKSKIIKFEDELVKPNRRRAGINPPTRITTFLDQKSIDVKITTIEQTFSWIKNISIAPDIEYVFLDVHLIYYKNSEYFPPLTSSHYNEWINSLGRDVDIVIVNLIDDVFNIWKAIQDKEARYPNTRLTLREILGWRSLEALQSDSLRNALNAPKEGEQRTASYMVSVRHPYSTFENLILQKTPACAYLSYPISKTRKYAKRIELINKFRDKMHELGRKHGIAIFDPVSIDELVLGQVLPSNRSQIRLDMTQRWPLDYSEILAQDTDSCIKIPTREIEDCLPAIKHQIQSRDLKLVEYAGILAVYRPYYGGLSTGVRAEINHAAYMGREVLIYSPPEDKMPKTGNPFDDNSITTINNIDEYFTKVGESMNELKEKTKPEGRVES